jgi:zinc transporter 1/2/3
METLYLQTIYLVITFIVTFIFGMLPYKTGFLKKFTLVMGILNAFSGGMFLSMGVVHILPEAIETY